jgi:hypothetical protein
VREAGERSAEGAREDRAGEAGGLAREAFYPIREGKKHMQNARDSCIVAGLIKYFYYL